MNEYRHRISGFFAGCDEARTTLAVVADFGYELDLVRIHLAQAQGGSSFLAVHTPDDSTAERVAAVAKTTHASAAQRYGAFMIEVLLAPAPGQPLP